MDTPATLNPKIKKNPYSNLNQEDSYSQDNAEYMNKSNQNIQASKKSNSSSKKKYDDNQTPMKSNNGNEDMSSSEKKKDSSTLQDKLNISASNNRCADLCINESGDKRENKLLTSKSTDKLEIDYTSLANKQLVSLQSFASCQCCSHQFDFSTHLPYAFKCGHFFCKFCIDSYFTEKDKSIKCPADGSIAKSIKELKVVKHFINGYVSNENENTIDSEQKTPKSTSGNNKSKDGKIEKIDLTDINDPDLYCTIHKGQKLTHFIEDTRECICVFCAVNKMKSNRNINIKEISEKCNEYINELNLMSEKHKNFMDTLQNVLNDVNNNKQNEEKKIAELYDKVINYLTNNKSALLSKVNELHTENANNIREKLDFISNKIDSGNNLKEMLSDVENSGKKVNEIIDKFNLYIKDSNNDYNMLSLTINEYNYAHDDENKVLKYLNNFGDLKSKKKMIKVGSHYKTNLYSNDYGSVDNMNKSTSLGNNKYYSPLSGKNYNSAAMTNINRERENSRGERSRLDRNMVGLDKTGERNIDRNIPMDRGEGRNIENPNYGSNSLRRPKKSNRLYGNNYYQNNYNGVENDEGMDLDPGMDGSSINRGEREPRDNRGDMQYNNGNEDMGFNMDMNVNESNMPMSVNMNDAINNTLAKYNLQGSMRDVNSMNMNINMNSGDYSNYDIAQLEKKYKDMDINNMNNMGMNDGDMVSGMNLRGSKKTKKVLSSNNSQNNIHDAREREDSGNKNMNLNSKVEGKDISKSRYSTLNKYKYIKAKDDYNNNEGKKMYGQGDEVEIEAGME